MVKLLIIGASRGIGLATVRAALDAGYDVRAFARSAASIAITDAKLEKMSGDALDPVQVARALDGVSAVIHAIGVGSLGELIMGTTLFSRSAAILVLAMETAGVRRLVMVTGAGAGNSRGRIGALYDNLVFPLILKRIYDDKDIAEGIVERSGLSWTIVRPGGLTNGPATKSYKVLVEMKDWRGGFISRADVADFLVKQVADTSLIRKTPLLIG